MSLQENKKPSKLSVTFSFGLPERLGKYYTKCTVSTVLGVVLCYLCDRAVEALLESAFVQ
jgi:hypothetical protein